MDGQTLLVGFLLGAAAAGALAWWSLRAAVARSTRRAMDLERELARARERLAELSRSTAEVFDSAARRIEEGAQNAHVALRARTAVDDTLWSSLDDAGGPAGGEQLGRAVRVAEATVGDVVASQRQLAGELDALERESVQAVELVTGAAQLEGAAAGRFGAVSAASQETSAAAEALDEALLRGQGSAGETAQLSTRVSAEAEKGYRAVHKTLDEIERIRDLTEVARTRINVLGERVAGIGDVVRVIHDIAERTNLLALNASIIAAQSGEHGRSFAVVAREIKALAQRTAASTKQISEQIRSVQEESERATAAMATGAAAVGDGFQVAIAAGDALGAIRESARNAQKQVQAMTRAFGDQSAAARQLLETAGHVTEGAAGLATVVRAQVSSGERLAAALEEIHAIAGRVADLSRNQRGTIKTCAEAIAHLGSLVGALARSERELRRRLDGLRTGAAEARGAEAELVTQLTSMHEATTRLRAEIDRLRAEA